MRWCAACLAMLWAQPLLGHDVGVTSVARVFIDELGPGRYVLSVADVGVPALGTSEELLPSGCVARPVSDWSAWSTTAVPTLPFECGRSLTDDDVIELPWDFEGVVAVARWSDGTTASAFVRGRGPSITIRLGDLRAGVASRLSLAVRYGTLGGEHILFGIDHLLFVLGLLLLVRGVGPLVKTITAFTVAHSVTLAATVLGWVSVRPGPLEAAIALSIVLLAREVVVGPGAQPSLVHRRPWLVALLFGLLHGFGFASALGQIGLRSADVPLALFSFNLGVEAGQLAFVALVLVAGRAFGDVLRTRMSYAKPALGYVLGSVATLWLVDRLPGVWGL